MRGLPFGRFLKSLFLHLRDHNTADSAAQLGYYLLLSVFPFLFFLVTLLAFLPVNGAVDDLMARLGEVMPKQAIELVRGHFNELIHTQRPHLLTLGLIAAVWSASRGVDSIRKGLNLAYDVKESRSWWRVNADAIAMTILGTALVLLALGMVAVGGHAGEVLADKLHVERTYAVVWGWARWPLTALIITFVAALAYYLLPDVQQDFKFITPGSVVGTGLWLLATSLFTTYVEHFGNYNATYGSIGGVIVLMIWLYISGLIFLVGGEVNAVIEHASPAGKDRGARAAGEAPVPKSERPSAGQGKEGEHPVDLPI